MDQLRVFLVDDHPLIRMAMSRILEADGRCLVVGEADNAEDAVLILDSLPTDLVVMDIQLPGMDGVAATRELKARHDNLKVVILSAFGDKYLLPSIEAGADDFLSKPYPDMALFTRVSSLIRMKQMVDELRLRHETSHELGLEGMTCADSGLNFADSSVLLVCNSRDLMAGTVAEIRGRLGCAIETAEGEAAARALLASNRYDACVIGPNLSDGEPMRIASLLRARPETRQTSVMMVFPPGDLSKAHLAMEMLYLYTTRPTQ